MNFNMFKGQYTYLNIFYFLNQFKLFLNNFIITFLFFKLVLNTFLMIFQTLL